MNLSTTLQLRQMLCAVSPAVQSSGAKTSPIRASSLAGNTAGMMPRNHAPVRAIAATRMA